MFKLLRFVVAAFFIATVVSSFLDLSLGSKLMPASSVHMAETSDKNFEDVVGIDEVSMDDFVLDVDAYARNSNDLEPSLYWTPPRNSGGIP